MWQHCGSWCRHSLIIIWVGEGGVRGREGCSLAAPFAIKKPIAGRFTRRGVITPPTTLPWTLALRFSSAKCFGKIFSIAGFFRIIESYLNWLRPFIFSNLFLFYFFRVCGCVSVCGFFYHHLLIYALCFSSLAVRRTGQQIRGFRLPGFFFFREGAWQIQFADLIDS